VEEQEVRSFVLSFVEDLVQRGEGDQHPVRLRRGLPNLEPAIIPALGERGRGYPFDGLHYVSYARHYQVGIVQSPG
jgi:hypothetical protein